MLINFLFYDDLNISVLRQRFNVCGNYMCATHRKAEVGRDSWKSCGSSPLLKLGHLQPVGHIHVQMAFEYLQAGTLQNLFVKTLLVLCQPHNKKACPDVQKETPAFQFVSIASGPVNHWATLKRTWLHPLCTSLSGICTN